MAAWIAAIVTACDWAQNSAERGAAALTDEELIAAILGMGTAGLDVRTMSKQVAALIREHQKDLTLDHLTT